MTTPDRRKTTRKLINQLAYVNLEANNGGIVLNVSEGGICFQAVAPIYKSRSIDFWLSLPGGNRIVAAGELAWLDATGKNGGLRFTSVSDEAREQICNWAGLPPPPRPLIPVVPVLPVVSMVPAVAAARAINDETAPHPPTADIASAPVAAVHIAPVPAVTTTPVSQSEMEFAAAAIPVTSKVAPSPQTRIPAPSPSKPLETVLAGALRVDAAISAALAAGTRRMEKTVPVAVASARRIIAPAIPAARSAAQRATKAVSTATRAYSTRSYFRAAVTTAIILVAAVSLIQLGGMLAGKTLPRVVSPAIVSGSPSNPASESPNLSAGSAPAVKPKADEPENQSPTAMDDLNGRSASPSANPSASDDASLAPARLPSKPISSAPPAIVTKPSYNTVLTRPATSPSPSSSSTPATGPKSTTSSLPPSTIASTRVAAAPTSAASPANSVATKPTASSLLESNHPTSTSGSETAGASIYFDVGSFKDPMWADKANETLAHSGFHAIVIHKGRFWMSSYHVVVGPFANGTAAQTAFSDLESHGYKPRPAKLNP
ncbi:MAG TPA: PilZ domain-containing protein [Candidatus Acidoferrales bacterium]